MDQKTYKAIKSYIRKLIKHTRWEDQVYLVGGCVRDEIIGCEISDIDLFVNQPRGGIRFTFWLHGKGFLEDNFQIFRRYGSSKVCFKDFPGIEIDISAPHSEESEQKGDKFSHEEASRFLCEDCMLRDLTINSVYEKVKSGEKIDLSGKGLPDIQNHIIRTTSAPETIYGLNPACMLRTIRFSVKYGWDLPEETYQGLVDNAHLLKEGRTSRIRKEYDKILQSPQAALMEGILLQLNMLECARQAKRVEEEADLKYEQRRERAIAKKQRRKEAKRKKQQEFEARQQAESKARKEERRKRNEAKQAAEKAAALERKKERQKKHQQLLEKQQKAKQKRLTRIEQKETESAKQNPVYL